jgi:hypothetical protein
MLTWSPGWSRVTQRAENALRLLLCLSNDQALSRGLHHRPRYATEAVDLNDAFLVHDDKPGRFRVLGLALGADLAGLPVLRIEAQGVRIAGPSFVPEEERFFLLFLPPATARRCISVRTRPTGTTAATNGRCPLSIRPNSC